MSKEHCKLIHAYPFNGEVITDQEQEDTKNTAHERTLDNVNMIAFNCGGYALETFNWFLPIMNKTAVDDDAEVKWLDANGFESRWDYCEATRDLEEDELEDYIRLKEVEGEEEILNLLSEISLPDDMDIEDAEDYALDLYQNHDYRSEVALRIASLSMLKAFPDMRIINDWTELKDDEYGVAYRGSDNDFHFIKFDQKKNEYSHKMGWQDVRTIENLDEGFEPRYDSRTVYFAKRRSAQYDS